MILIVSWRNGPIRREAVAQGQGKDDLSGSSLAATVKFVLEESILRVTDLNKRVGPSLFETRVVQKCANTTNLKLTNS